MQQYLDAHLLENFLEHLTFTIKNNVELLDFTRLNGDELEVDIFMMKFLSVGMDEFLHDPDGFVMVRQIISALLSCKLLYVDEGVRHFEHEEKTLFTIDDKIDG